MNCVYHAYCAHLRFMDIEPTQVDWFFYRTFKTATHGTKTQPTNGGVVPYMIRLMAMTHNLKTMMQYSLMTKEHHLYEAQNKMQRWVIEQTDWSRAWEVKPFHFSVGGIFLLAGSQHAIFSALPITFGAPIMAIRLYK